MLAGRLWPSGPSLELELELIQTQMAQKPMLRAEVHARALRASQNVKGAEVWVGARCEVLVSERGAAISPSFPRYQESL